MTPPLSIRLRFGEWWVTVTPTDEEKFLIDVTDVQSHPPINKEERKRACRQLLKVLSELRQQVFYDELDGVVEAVDAAAD